jgi:hypothetical protein
MSFASKIPKNMSRHTASWPFNKRKHQCKKKKKRKHPKRLPSERVRKKIAEFTHNSHAVQAGGGGGGGLLLPSPHAPNPLSHKP